MTAIPTPGRWRGADGVNELHINGLYRTDSPGDELVGRKGVNSLGVALVYLHKKARVD